ncbi:RNA polymerase sigma factor [Bacillus cereus]|uniref:hypothetical protein n=1 Tax=Bacillus cereus TaxID=1396 RepID=UPI001D0E2AFD|nr:hypothetical protein [Bacillus cereus]MCC2383536.1 hypothetical protein [Bacillus cereus]
MGAISVDIHKKGREYGNLYGYKREGVKALLKDIYRLSESKLHKGDIDAAAILTDLNISLNNECLTPKQRQCIALYYFVNLSIKEASSILDIYPSVFNYHIKGALSRLANNMRFGTVTKKGDPIGLFGNSSGVYKWLDEIALGKPLEEPPYEVVLDIAEILSKSDEKSSEMIRQHIEGFVYVEENEGEEYPCLCEEQMRWADRRVSYVEEVFPPGDVTGYHRVLIRDDEDRKGVEYKEERRKIFKRRGN